MNSLMSNQSLAKRWFQSCTTTHSRCRPRPCDTNFPTRLLEIDGSEEHTSIRIITTDKNPRAGEYLTLSHCWGDAEFITLRKDNLAELEQGIELAKLPKTFQDAVAVSQWFNIRYLWIDSLCIFQDSKEDWAKESVTMRSVYSHSIMNISATGAIDPSIGCFLDRNADHLRPFSVFVSYSKKEYFCFDADFWRANISDAPLSKRAWAFQERLLSPRILHFGSTQMSWECMEFSSCETFPEGVRETMPQLGFFFEKRNLFDPTRGFSIDMWENLVSHYTNCAMTVPSDIYMAFAGLVEEIHSLTTDEYCAGLWRKELEEQLLWEQQDSENWKPTGYRAPSWSWFSVFGVVDFILGAGKYEGLFKVLDVIVDNSTVGLYGPVTYGCLKCQGILGHAVCQWTKSRGRVIQTAHGPGLISMDCKMDYRSDLLERKVTYLPVLNYEHNGVVLAGSGLLLEPTYKKEEEYQRIGTFKIWSGPGSRRLLREHRLLREQTSENGSWVDRPQQIFTIV